MKPEPTIIDPATVTVISNDVRTAKDTAAAAIPTLPVWSSITDLPAGSHWCLPVILITGWLPIMGLVIEGINTENAIRFGWLNEDLSHEFSLSK